MCRVYLLAPPLLISSRLKCVRKWKLIVKKRNEVEREGMKLFKCKHVETELFSVVLFAKWCTQVS
jgi:hypothetical protein